MKGKRINENVEKKRRSEERKRRRRKKKKKKKNSKSRVGVNQRKTETVFETSSILPCFPLRHVHVDTTCTIPSRGESSLNIYERAESASVQALGNAASFFLAINPASMRPPDRRDVGPTSRRGVSSSSPSSIVGRALKTLVEISIRLRRPSWIDGREHVLEKIASWKDRDGNYAGSISSRFSEEEIRFLVVRSIKDKDLGSLI